MQADSVETFREHQYGINANVNTPIMPASFFSEFTPFKALLYGGCAVYVLCSAAVVMIEPFMTLPCVSPGADDTLGTFPNVLYVEDPCQTSTRYFRLLGLTPRECAFGRYLVVATLLGGVVGYERRGADRPAGIRTMSLVSLAAALFTLNSTFVFMVGPMGWDPARVSAAVPSGVGFLGGGLIVKELFKDSDGDWIHTVKGLNTAASVWLSAAVGVACGGGLLFVASFTTALMLVLLRFGPGATYAREGTLLPETGKDVMVGRSSRKLDIDEIKTRGKRPTMSFA